MEHSHRQQPTTPPGDAVSGRPVDDHGRAVTATAEAAAWYRRAQRSDHLRDAGAALRLAVISDPGFALAIADLDAITRTPPRPSIGRLTNWERHHIEVVKSAGAGNFNRAADLFRELLAATGCDPLAMSIVTDLAQRSGKEGHLNDLSPRTPGCHRAWLGRSRGPLSGSREPATGEAGAVRDGRSDRGS